MIFKYHFKKKCTWGSRGGSKDRIREKEREREYKDIHQMNPDEIQENIYLFFTLKLLLLL